VSGLLVLTALAAEARALARHLGLSAVPRATFPHYRGGAVEIAVVGLRAAVLAERAVAFGPCSLVVSAGVCGALSPTLRWGDLVVPESVIDTRGVVWPTADVPGLPRRGTVLAVDEIAATPAAKARLWLDSGAAATDMESGVIMAWARRRGVDALVVRGVSDTANETVPPDLAAAVTADGRTRPMRAMQAALARPSALGDALALRRGVQAALAAVAPALGTAARRVAVTR
jgi:nucleoside phosphorylase